ncbi:hypothetical protein [Burkholderia sp. MSMB1835]|uniref:hypothetical protein n=1 Tax=Burkholderia sp. MSMB1835 TaxID=1637876 RepID=UPI000A61AC07|nr:hypothetical protein [Burkholderia sp. MSMB1835]
MAWCEGEIAIARPPVTGKSGGIVLHFFPDGRVEGDMDCGVDGPDPKAALSKRDARRKLTDRACLKEIPSPFHGRKKPPQWH